MIGIRKIGIGLNLPKAGGFVGEYQTVYNVLTTKPSAAIATAQNTMVVALVSSGVWAKLDWFALFAQTTNGDSEALKNWINPGTNDPTIINAPAFVALEGITGGGGAGKYINTNFNPTTNGVNYTQNSSCMFAYFRNNVSEAAYEMGYTGLVDSFLISRFNTDTAYIRMNGSINSDVANTDSRGMFIVNRTLSTHQDLYKNKIRIINGAHASIGIPNGDIYVLCQNSSGPSGYGSKQVSVAGLGGGLTQTNVDDLTDAIEVYMDSNSKGVIP